MKNVGLLLALMVCAVPSRAALDCGFPDHPDADMKRIVLDDHDFAEINQNDKTVTKQYFNTLQRGTRQRNQICFSRAIWRRVKSNKATSDDFTKYFADWVGDYWGSKPEPDGKGSEFDQVLNAQLNLTSRVVIRRQSTRIAKS